MRHPELVEGPVRQCAGCRERKPQADLRRFVRTGQRTWQADGAGKRQPGRGTYLCPGRACVERVEKNKKFPGLAASAVEYGL